MTHRDIHGWIDSGLMSLYSFMAYCHGDGAVFVELGSWLGKSTVFMAEQIRKSGHKIKFYCVDLFEYTHNDPIYKEDIERIGNLYQKFLQNITYSGNLDLITPLKCDSVWASTLFPDKSVDFIYIDANHNYMYVRDDVTAWLPKVRAGGYMCGHDYDKEGVKKAVDEIFPQVEIIETSWQVRI